MNLEEVLEDLERLLKKWGINSSQWILVAGYAYKLLGYDIHVRKGHFNILITRDKIPWEVKEGIEIHPPRGTNYREDFRKLIVKTGYDFDINLSTNQEFEKKEGKFELYTLPNGTKIKVQKPIGAIEELHKLLSFSTKNALGIERLQKDTVFIEDMIQALTKRGEERVVTRFKNPLQEYKKFQKETILAEPIQRSKKLKGIVASSGKAVGRARVVQKAEDLRGLKDGDVLVTQMTSPTLIVNMPNVSALVTDWGGKLSHAAILAREMNIPCIVGTQTATKILKSGDLVEVDAEKGIVKRLRK